MTETPHTVVHIPMIPSPRRPTIETDSKTMAPPRPFVSKRTKRTKREATAACGGEEETQFEMDEVEMMIGEWESPC